jgi:hypothetical protein
MVFVLDVVVLVASWSSSYVVTEKDDVDVEQPAYVEMELLLQLV